MRAARQAREVLGLAQRCRHALGACQQTAGLATAGEAALAAASPPQPTGGWRLADPGLPLPSFVGRRRAPLDVMDALAEVKAGARRTFDESVELALRLGTDPRKGEQQVRGAVVLPHGTGRRVRVAVIAEGEAAALARESGADVVGSDEVIAAVKAGEIPFDKCLATADMMPRLAGVARVLGPRGLMPNPKLGTLVDLRSLPGAVRQMKGGRVEYRADRTAILAAGIGKASFPLEQLYQNLGALAAAVLAARPRGVKGSGMAGYILSAHVSSTMGRGVPLALPSLQAAVQRARK